MSIAEPRLTHSTLKVLKAFLAEPRLALSGAEIAAQAGIGSGTLYPMLARLEKAGWFTSEWEPGDPRELGRPRRRSYTLTALGQRKSVEAFDSIEPVGGVFSWA